METAVGGAMAAQSKWANYLFQKMTFYILSAFSGMPQCQYRRSCQMDIGVCLFDAGLPLRW